MAKVWMTRMEPRMFPDAPQEKLDVRPYCLDKGIVSIGWGFNLASSVPFEQQDGWDSLNATQQEGLRLFAQMQVGDLVIVPRGDVLYGAVIAGPLQYSDEQEMRSLACSNHYKAEWLAEHWRRDGFAAHDEITRKLGQRGVTHDLLHENRQEFENLYRPTSA